MILQTIIDTSNYLTQTIVVVLILDLNTVNLDGILHDTENGFT
jgi:hypothetical protein